MAAIPPPRTNSNSPSPDRCVGTAPVWQSGPANRSTQWHQLDARQVLRDFQVDEDSGLPESEVALRLSECGPNQLSVTGIKSAWLILWEQLTALMVVILIAAAAVSALLGDYADSVAITAIVLLNALLGFTQEYLTVLFQLALLYVLFFRGVFRITALAALDLGLSAALAAIIFTAVELEKRFAGRLRLKYQPI